MSTAERVEIILLCERGGLPEKGGADEFFKKHPEQETVLHIKVGRLKEKSKDTENVADSQQNGCSKTSEEIGEGVLQNVIGRLIKKTNAARQLENLLSLKHRLEYFVKEFVLISIVTYLSEDDPDSCIKIYPWFLTKLEEDL